MVTLEPWLRRSVAPANIAGYSGFRGWRRFAVQALLVPLLLAFCFLYGAAFGIFGPTSLIALAVPIVLLTLLVIWALPDLESPPLNALGVLLYASLVAQYVWPNYLAISLPGLPWITVDRLIGYPLFLLALTCLSTSVDFRKTLRDLVVTSPRLASLVAGFLLLQVLSVALSHDKSASINKALVNVVEFPRLLIGAYLFVRPGQIRKLFSTFWIVAIFIGLLGIWQYRLHHVPWAGHIPSFLRINDPSVQEALGGTGRAYTNIYRVNSTFVTSLGLSEYLALVFPFVIYTLVNPGPPLVRSAALLSLPFLVYVVVLTGSRLGVVGCLLSTCLYPAFVGLQRWRREKSSLLAPAVSLAYPILFVAVVCSTFFVGRLKTHIWGGGAQKASSQARIDQLHMGIPLILHNPLGYGIGRGAETLGYAPFGFLTIDSYYLLIALEYGVIGFAVFYGMIVFGIVKAALLAVDPVYIDEDQGLAVPICVALISFIIIKGVFAQADNVGLMYLMLMALMALAYRSRLGRREEHRARQAPHAVHAAVRPSLSPSRI